MVIHGANDRRSVDIAFERHVRNLTKCMHAGIRPPGTGHRDSLSFK
jgi:hypothetical protein